MSDEAITSGGGRTAGDDDQVAAGYAEALDELEAILAELEDDDIDVDALAGRVERASDLLRFCRARIDEAEMTVERIVTDLADPDDEPGGDDGPGDGETTTGTAAESV